MRRALLVLGIVLLSGQGCLFASRQVAHRMPDEHTDRYRVHATGNITVALPGGSPRSSPYTLDILVDSFVARVFRDDTRGLLLTITDFEGTIDEGAQKEIMPRDDLIGTTLALRARPSGEIYRMVGSHTFSGPERRGPLWMHTLLATAFRLPSSSWEGDGGPEYHFTIPIPISDTARVDQRWKLKYTHAAEVDCDGQTCVAFTWNADLIEAGKDTSGITPSDVSGVGSAHGVLFWRSADRRVTKHTYQWAIERTITIPGTSSVAVTNRLDSDVTITFEGTQ